MSGWRKRQIQERENSMIKISFANTAMGVFLYLSLLILLLGGWVMNLVEIVNYDLTQAIQLIYYQNNITLVNQNLTQANQLIHYHNNTNIVGCGVKEVKQLIYYYNTSTLVN